MKKVRITAIKVDFDTDHFKKISREVSKGPIRNIRDIFSGRFSLIYDLSIMSEK